MRSKIFWFFCAKITHSRLAWSTTIWPKTVLLLELERLYESCTISWSSVAIRQDGLSSRQGRPSIGKSSFFIYTCSTKVKMSLTPNAWFCAVQSIFWWNLSISGRQLMSWLILNEFHSFSLISYDFRNFRFFVSRKNLSFGTTFSKTIEMKQQVHFWIGLDSS